MNTTSSTEIALWALAQMPFLDAVEFSAITALPGRTARETLSRLGNHDCAGIVHHTRSDGFRVRRWYLSPRGIGELAKARLMNETVGELLETYGLMSYEGRRFLVRRLDAVEVIYKVAQHVANEADDFEGPRLTWRWERQGAFDAVLRLQSGHTLAISRIGSTHTGAAIKTRLMTLRNVHRRGDLPATLLLVPGVMELHRATAYLRSHGIYQAFVVAEPDLFTSCSQSEPWLSPKGRTYSIRDVLADAQVSTMPPTRRPEERRTLPASDISNNLSELDLASRDFSNPSRRLLRLLYDWPFSQISQLQRMMGVSRGHMGRSAGQLSRAGLIHHVRIGRTPQERRTNQTRLTLSEAGLVYLSRVDRSSTVIARNQWAVEPSDDGDTNYHINSFRVSGTKARSLLRERLHTDGVNAFISLLMDSCRRSAVWDILQVLPAHRWERRYNYGTRRNRQYRYIARAIRPDAIFILRHPDRPFASFVLEFERRARSQSTIGPKIERYRPYFASDETQSDFPDGRPTILFVFEGREYAANFVSYTKRIGGRPLPMLVSSLDDLEQAGSVFRNRWLNPWRLNAGHLTLSSTL